MKTFAAKQLFIFAALIAYVVFGAAFLWAWPRVAALPWLLPMLHTDGGAVLVLALGGAMFALIFVASVGLVGLSGAGLMRLLFHGSKTQAAEPELHDVNEDDWPWYAYVAAGIFIVPMLITGSDVLPRYVYPVLAPVTIPQLGTAGAHDFVVMAVMFLLTLPMIEVALVIDLLIALARRKL